MKIKPPILISLITSIIVSCSSPPVKQTQTENTKTDKANQLFVVDCLLPGQVRKLGKLSRYLTARRPIKTTAVDCEIRGGEYVAYDRANYASSLKIWLPKAQAGDAQAQTYVGEIYEKGRGVSPDYQLAAHWYQKAAEQNNSRAQLNLGFLYEQGLGVPKNPETAMQWYRKASGLPENLAYTSTLQSDNSQTELKNELVLLKNDLKSSQNESQQLSKQLQQTQQQLKQNQQQLQNSSAKLSQSQQQATKLVSNSQESLALQTVISNQEKEIKQHQQTISSLEQQYQQKATLLSQKLSETEKRASQMATAIKNSQSKDSQSQQQLLTIQAQLASKEQQLLTLKQQQYKPDNQQQNFQKQQTKITQLETEKKRFEQTIQRLKQQKPITNKPIIEIIDPPVVHVRGVPTVTLRSIVQSRTIIGKVKSQSKLLSLLVNDRPNNLDDQGLFQANIAIKNTETPVSIVAINKQGGRASLNFSFSLAENINRNERTQQVTQAVQKKPWKKLNFGNYHALIIGNNNYQKIPSLDTPINDAKAVELVLKQHYGFKTHILLNADRYQILSKLNKLRAQLTEKDNLLIYYAGHGELDRVNMRGHWLPVDADSDNTANWISTVAITDILNSMSVKHIMVVADSCYSGAMTRASLARLDSGMSQSKKSQWLKAMIKAQSRTVLTSGGLKPVMDGGGGDHSVFANAFIKALKNNNNLLEGQSLYNEVSANIVAIASEYGIEQVPIYAPIQHAGHESGEFFFIPK